MINYNEFYELLKKVNLITPIWKYELDLISNEIKNEKNKDYYLIIFAIYFSLVNSGNICISLNKDILSNKWNKQVLGSLKLEEDKDDFDLNIFDEIKNISNEAFNYLNEIKNLNVVGINHIFEIVLPIEYAGITVILSALSILEFVVMNIISSKVLNRIRKRTIMG